MGYWEFRWDLLPARLLGTLAGYPDRAAGGPRAGAEALALALAETLGATPTDEHAKGLWRLIRDGWILPDADRVSRVATMLDALEVGRAARASAADDEDFLRSVRDSAGLRHAVVRYLVALGSPTRGLPDDPVEIAAAADRRPAEPVPAPTSDPNGRIPSGDFAPRTAADFSRLAGMTDLEWGLYLLHLFNAAERLLPGEALVVRAMSGEPANNGAGEGALAVSIAHDVGGVVFLGLMPEPLLPSGLSYERLWPALSDLGWQRDQAGTVFAQLPWPDGIDDAVAMVALTFRAVFLVDSPVRLEQSDEIRPPDGKLPAAPDPADVIQPEGPSELLAVVSAVLREAGGTILTGADSSTHAFRMGRWSGWIHADAEAPILDVVIVVADLTTPASPGIDPDDVLAMQSTAFRFGRIVLTPTQVVIAASVPFHAFTTLSVHALIGGLMADAASALGLAAPVVPPAPGTGGYL